MPLSNSGFSYIIVVNCLSTNLLDYSFAFSIIWSISSSSVFLLAPNLLPERPPILVTIIPESTAIFFFLVLVFTLACVDPVDSANCLFSKSVLFFSNSSSFFSFYDTSDGAGVFFSVDLIVIDCD